MTRRRIVDLHESELLRNIPREVLEGLDITLEMVSFSSGEVFFEEGAEGDCCYLVESGLVRISKSAGAGAIESLGMIGPGEFFGELALFYETPRSATATAVIPTRTARLERAAFDQLRTVAPLAVTDAVATAGIRHLRQLHDQVLTGVTNSDRFRDIGLGLGIIAHDMRSPLATIRNGAELLIDMVASGTTEGPRLLKFLEIISRTAAGALEGTDELLAEIRGERSQARGKFSLSELVEEVTEQARGVAAGKPIRLRAVIERQGSVVGAKGRLARALGNLLRNAIEAMPPEGGEIELLVRDEGEGVVFTVSDTGRGMEPGVMARIFERRYTHDKAGGTGLGLSQVKQVVELHGGHITVDSTEGVGSVFRIWIPQPSR